MKYQIILTVEENTSLLCDGVYPDKRVDILERILANKAAGSDGMVCHFFRRMHHHDIFKFSSKCRREPSAEQYEASYCKDIEAYYS